MSITTEQTEKLLKNSLPFKQLGFSMLITRLRKLYEVEKTADSVDFATAEINTFLKKYEKVMEADYALITKL